MQILCGAMCHFAFVRLRSCKKRTNLPNSTHKVIDSKIDPLTISINKAGLIFIMKEQINIKKLQTKLQNILKSKKEELIYIKADKTLNYGYIMSIISKVTDAGFSKISLITQSN